MKIRWKTLCRHGLQVGVVGVGYGQAKEVVEPSKKAPLPRAQAKTKSQKASAPSPAAAQRVPYLPAKSSPPASTPVPQVPQMSQVPQVSQLPQVPQMPPMPLVAQNVHTSPPPLVSHTSPPPPMGAQAPLIPLATGFFRADSNSFFAAGSQPFSFSPINSGMQLPYAPLPPGGESGMNLPLYQQGVQTQTNWMKPEGNVPLSSAGYGRALNASESASVDVECGCNR